MNQKIKQDNEIKIIRGREKFYRMWLRKGIFEMRFKWQEGSSHVHNWETALQAGNSKYSTKALRWE